MILVGSQRGGASNLSSHLTNREENDHVTVEELRGFMAADLHGALSEAHAVSKGTNCKQFMFSLSINPPRNADASLESMIEAANRAEEALGLGGQPRAIVVHEKKGRRHVHVVWSRIGAAEMKAVNLPFFKNRLAALSKALFLEHGWDLPDGHKENGWKNPLNFTRAEWEQCKRLDLDPREVKQLFRDAWARSDDLLSFRNALEERGYFLAAGDRRGFVAVGVAGEVFSLSRMSGIKSKDIEARLGSPDRLLSVDETKARTAKAISKHLRQHLREFRDEQRSEAKPLADEHKRMVRAHRLERVRLTRGQEARRLKESRERQLRLRSGVGGVWDLLTGRAATIRRQNDHELFRDIGAT